MVCASRPGYWQEETLPAFIAGSVVFPMSSRAFQLSMQTAPLVSVIDPDASVRRSVSKLLHALGAQVECYATAKEFLDHLPTAIPAVVIAEARLPDLSGLTLLQELRGRGLDIPVILLSSDADVTSAVTAMRAGALDFIEKPFIDRALAAQLGPILELNGKRSH
jgi:two-component system response regulator FixJ